MSSQLRPNCMRPTCGRSSSAAGRAAEQNAGVENKLRETLRATMLQLRDVQTQLATLVIEHQQIGKVVLVEHIANRQIGPQLEHPGCFREHQGPRPQIQNAAQDVQRPAGEIEEGQLAHWRPDLRPGARRESTHLLPGVEAIDAGDQR